MPSIRDKSGLPQHISFEQRSRCCYDRSRCSNEPLYYLLMGCFNQHTGEGAICVEHARLWVNYYQDKDVACKYCGLGIEEYLLFPAENLT